MDTRRPSISSGKSSHGPISSEKSSQSECGTVALVLGMCSDIGIFIVDLSNTYLDDEFVIVNDEKFVSVRPSIRIRGGALDYPRFCVIGCKLYIFCVNELPRRVNESRPPSAQKVYSVDLSPALSKPQSEIILDRSMLKEEPTMLSSKQFPAAVPYNHGTLVVLFSTLIRFCDWDLEGVAGATDFEIYVPTGGNSIKLPQLCICCGTPERKRLGWPDQLLPPVYRLLCSSSSSPVEFTPKYSTKNWKWDSDFRITAFGLYEATLIVKTNFGTMFSLDIENSIGGIGGGWRLCEDCFEFIDDYDWNFVTPNGICVNPYGIIRVRHEDEVARKWVDFPISSISPGFILRPLSSISVTILEDYSTFTCSPVIAQLALEDSGMKYDSGRSRLFWTLDVLKVDLLKFQLEDNDDDGDDGDGQQHKRIKSFKDDEDVKDGKHEIVRLVKSLKFCLNDRVIADCSGIISMFSL